MLTYIQLGFASTECGLTLLSVPGKAFSRYRSIKDSLFSFVPVQGDTEEQRPRPKLVELVVLSDSSDCPIPALRSADDGHFHTGDLFEEVEPGLYESRGRNDDWIKLISAGRCNTR